MRRAKQLVAGEGRSASRPSAISADPRRFFHAGILSRRAGR
jgi:hypothetical protein